MVARIVALGAAVTTCADGPVRAGDASLRFRDGDRWTVVGDSITHTGYYHHYLSLYYLTRFPGRKLTVANAGLSGDTAAGAMRRYDWDIAPTHATVATVMLGMNDVGRGLYPDAGDEKKSKQQRERLAAYEKNLRQLVGALQQDQVRVILLSPSPYDQSARIAEPAATGVDDALARCAELVATIGREMHAGVVDFHGPMAEITRAHQRAEPAFTLVGPDRIHPGRAGHLVMAYLLLNAQAAPAIVSRLAIDATTGRVSETDNGTAEQLHVTADGLSLVWRENALPCPVDAEARVALDWVPFVQEFDEERLRITGLPRGDFELAIDGVAVRTLSAAAWAEGINLATETATPQYRQAEQVSQLLERRTRLVADDLRGATLFEHQAGAAVPHPCTLEQIAPYLDTRLKELKLHPLPVFGQQTVELYAERKQRFASSEAEAARLWEEAEHAAMPVAHTITLRRR